MVYSIYLTMASARHTISAACDLFVQLVDFVLKSIFSIFITSSKSVRIHIKSSSTMSWPLRKRTFIGAAGLAVTCYCFIFSYLFTSVHNLLDLEESLSVKQEPVMVLVESHASNPSPQHLPPSAENRIAILTERLLDTQNLQYYVYDNRVIEKTYTKEKLHEGRYKPLLAKRYYGLMILQRPNYMSFHSVLQRSSFNLIKQ